jgi:hypothetical protein
MQRVLEDMADHDEPIPDPADSTVAMVTIEAWPSCQ